MTGDTAGFRPVGLGVTLAFPVIQLSILHGTVVPSMVIDTHVSLLLARPRQPERSRPRLGRGVVGVSRGGVLGLELEGRTAQETVFEKAHEVENGDGCAAFSG